MIIYVTGFIGSDRRALAEQLAKEHNLPLYDLNAEIEKRENQSIRRLVMTMGEHELRNKEYETLVALLGELGETDKPDTVDPDLPMVCSRCQGLEATGNVSEETIDATTLSVDGGLGDLYKGSPEPVAVMVLGDDVILDPMSYDIVRAGEVHVATGDLETMFAAARADDSTHYAFLMDPDEDRARQKFLALYEQRKPLYDALATCTTRLRAGRLRAG